MKKLLASLLLCLTASLSFGQDITYNSPCSVEAVGRRPDNNMIVGPYKAVGLYVNKLGFWDRCPSWAKEGEVVPDAPPVVVKEEPGCDGAPSVSWEQDGNVCNSQQSAQGPLVPKLKSRDVWVATADVGLTRGAISYRCVAGKLEVLGSKCEQAVTCPNRVEIEYGTNAACKVKTDFPGAPPTLGMILAVPADAKPGYSGSAVLICQFGGWAFAESPKCIKLDN